MTYWENSIVLSLGIRVWDYITLLFKSSALCRFCMYLRRVFTSSLMYRAGSGESRVEAAWESSLFRAVAEFFLNIAPRLLSAACRSIGEAARSSFMLRLIAWLGGRSAHIISLGILLMLITPYNRWNNYYSLLLAAAALVLFWLRALRDDGSRLELSHTGAWPALFSVTVSLSFLWSQSSSQSLRFLVFAVTCVALVIVFVNSVKSEKTLLFAVKCCGFGLFICSAYAVYQGIVGVEANPSFTDLSLNFGMPGRVYSFFENPNSFANLLVFFAPLMLSMGFYAPKTRQKLGFFAVFGLCSLALVMTGSRGGWLAFAFAGFVLMLILCPRWIPLVVIVVICAVPLLPDFILNRALTIFNLADSSTNSRWSIYEAMLMTIARNPLFGVGLGPNALKYAVETTGVFHATFPFIHAHNIYMEIWGESGIFALIAFIMTLFLPMRTGVRRIKKGAPPIARGVTAGCISGLAGSLIFGITDFAWGYPRVMVLYWFVFALLCAANKISTGKDILSHGK